MATIKVRIDSVLNGIAPTNFVGQKGTYNSAIGIDTDQPIGTDKKTSGMLVPTVYEKFSGAEVTGYPYWIITSPKSAYVYVYDSTGKIVRYSTILY